MSLGVFSILFPVLLAVVMFSLGLALTVADFARVLVVPRAVLITLLCQVVLLPARCFGLVSGVVLGPNLAVGMMVLAASPRRRVAGWRGGHRVQPSRGGDVALNITVAAVNSVLAVFTLTVVVALSVDHFLGGADATVGLQIDKVVQIGLVVLVPVGVGMTVRRRLPAFADRIQGSLRTTTIVAVFVAIVASIVNNAVLAITMSISVLNNPIAAVAPATYGTLMYLPVAAFAGLTARHTRPAPRSAAEGAVEAG